MSNALAIAAVTATLRNLLAQGIAPVPDLADTIITTQSPDRARSNGSTSNQLNIFLFLTTPNAAWRNMDNPARAKPGETGMPPLALDLQYLFTAYGQDNDIRKPFSHELLGTAMSILHDHPLLGADEIAAALPDSDLQNQIERVRFTIQPLSIEEIFRLWSGFQTQYRLSVGYLASVVLIDSTRPVRAPLPVLARSKNDSGIRSVASPVPPFPALDPLASAPLAPGDLLAITGNHLDGAAVAVRFRSDRIPIPLDVPTLAGATAQQVSVKIPNSPKTFPAGAYLVSVVVSTADDTSTTNEISIQVAPKITTVLPLTAQIVNGSATIQLSFTPDSAPGQRVSLLLGSQEVIADPIDPQKPSAATFVVPNAAAGDYLARLRVDGVDSNLLVDRNAAKPAFDQTQKVTIAP